MRKFRQARKQVRRSMMPDRKSTRLNSSHLVISYAVFCLKKTMLHLLLRYTQAFITAMSQTGACNRHQSLDQQLSRWLLLILYFFFFNDTATTEIYTFSLHDALPI